MLILFNDLNLLIFQLLSRCYFFFFFLSGFPFTDVDDSQHCSEGRGPSFIPLYHFHPLLRHLFATLHVRWLSRIFNRNACVYHTATRWDLPPYRITIWLIDWWCNVCLFTWWIDSRFLLQRCWHWKPVDLNSHRLSPLYYKRND